MFCFSGTAASGQMLPLWSIFVNKWKLICFPLQILHKKERKIPVHHIILGNLLKTFLTSLPLLVHIETPTPGPARSRGDPPSYHPIKSPTTTSTYRRQYPCIVFYQLLKKEGSDTECMSWQIIQCKLKQLHTYYIMFQSTMYCST